MKNKLILLLSIVFVIIMVGCSNNSNTTVNNGKKIENEKQTYIKYVQKLKKSKESTEDLKYDINVTFDKLDDEEIRYQVTIDNAKINMENVKALAIHNMQTDDIFPSVGIFDDATKLKKEDEKSGIVLVGYIPYEGEMEDLDCEIKVLISYNVEENKYTDYYVTKK